jgi:glycosyltransferase involved in cell wall biosynthesis
VPEPTALAGRTLILVPKLPAGDRDERMDAGEEPRVEYLELAKRLGADLLDYRAVAVSESRIVRWLGRWFGPRVGLAFLGYMHCRDYEHVYATGEDLSIPLMPFLRLARVSGRLTVVVHHAGGAGKMRVLRLLGHRAYRHVIVLCAEQQRILSEKIGIPAARITRVPIWCDHRYFRAERVKPASPGDYLLSVGMESRDYPTLQLAARELPYPLHVVASGWSRGAGFAAADGIDGRENLTIERGVPTTRLRQLYAGCRMLVVPLKSVTYAAGVTSIVEAMAMGKAVVVSASPGILDYVRDGVSGRVVPIGDPGALREAIVDLWEHPEVAARMGEHNRAWVESEINMDVFVERVARMLGAVPEAVDRPGGVVSRPGSRSAP